MLIDDVDGANPWRDSLLGEQFAAWANPRSWGLSVLLDHDGATRAARSGPVEVGGDRLRVLVGGSDLPVLLDRLWLVVDQPFMRWFGAPYSLGPIEHRVRVGCCGVDAPMLLTCGQVGHGSIALDQVPVWWRGRRVRARVSTRGRESALSRPFVIVP